jgi:hypothetical protein
MAKVDRARIAGLHTAGTAELLGTEKNAEPKKTRRTAAGDETTERSDRAPPSAETRRNARARFEADNNVRLRATRLHAGEDKKKPPKDVRITGTNGDDRIRVTRLRDGRTRVDNNGEVTTYAADRRVIINAKGGNDRVRLSGQVDVDVLGGNGTDRIDARRSTGAIFVDAGKGDDRVIGGRGDDILSGMEGNDRISGNGGSDQLLGGDGRDDLSGGKGTDVAHGGLGDDVLNGGDGRDYLSGQGGSDVIRGGRGNDTLTGNDGSDVLSAGRGNDVLIGRRGEDVLRTGAGKDVTYEGSTDIPKNIKIQGPAAFRRRVRDDLETLASTPSGRRLLDDLAARGHEITIQPDDEDYAEFDRRAATLRRDGTPGPGAKNTTIGYTGIGAILDDGVGQVAPPVVLFHELVHAYNAATGTVPPDRLRTDGVLNAENIAVGLPIDHDGNPKTPRIQPNPYFENQFREELNIPRRPRYE